MFLALGDFLLDVAKHNETDPVHKAAYSLAHAVTAGAILFSSARRYRRVMGEAVTSVYDMWEARDGQNGTVRDLNDKQQSA